MRLRSSVEDPSRSICLLDLPSEILALCLSSIRLRGASARRSCRALWSVDPKTWLTSAFESTWSMRPRWDITCFIAERQFQLRQIVLRGRIPAQMLRLLLQADGVEVNVVMGTGCTLLALASEESPALVDTLLEFNADPNLPWDSPGELNYPLHIASQEWHDSVVRSLLRANAGVNAINGWGQTALELAFLGHSCDRELCGPLTRLRGRPQQAIIDALLHAGGHEGA